jgi:hypothetical protein
MLVAEENARRQSLFTRSQHSYFAGSVEANVLLTDKAVVELNSPQPSPAKSRVFAVVLLAFVWPPLIACGITALFGNTPHVQEPLHQCLELSELDGPGGRNAAVGAREARAVVFRT